jgi:hypothetical protein
MKSALFLPKLRLFDRIKWLNFSFKSTNLLLYLKEHFAVDLLSYDLMLFFLNQAIFPLDKYGWRAEQVLHVYGFKDL